MRARGSLRLQTVTKAPCSLVRLDYAIHYLVMQHVTSCVSAAKSWRRWADQSGLQWDSVAMVRKSSAVKSGLRKAVRSASHCSIVRGPQITAVTTGLRIQFAALFR